jgi:hypothetical protein
MFHIKTDIRQFKCESPEKVERLIRNWVIRPSDLIYNAQEKTWNPIGQHPTFDDIFAGIEQEEANEPDTVVTEAPSEVAAEHEVEPGSELEAPAASVGGDVGDDEESTNVSPAPAPAASAAPEASVAASGEAVASASIIIDTESATLAADSEEITNVTEAPEAAPEDEITDVREDPRRDTDEQDAPEPSAPEPSAPEPSAPEPSAPEPSAAEASAPAPPEPSDEVEGLIRDSDEITMMTDKTFEMLSEEREADKAKLKASAQADSEAHEDGASKEAVEKTDEEAPEESPEEAPEESSEEDKPKKSSGGGRHGLPEEVFVTDEIPRQDVQQAVLDDLGELREDAEPSDEDDEVTELLDREGDDGDNQERKSRWRIVMSDDADGDEEVDDDDVDAQDAAEAKGVCGSDSSGSDSSGSDSSELDRDAAATSADPGQSSEAHEDSSADVTSEDDELDEMLDEAAELVGLGEDSEPIDIDGGALERVEGDEEDQESDGRERTDTPVRAVVEPKEFISEGYKLPLPVDISPSAEDIRLGLVHSRVGKVRKDATFPYPKPKRRDEVSHREYDLDPEEPADHSVLIVAAFLVGVLIIVLGAVTILG